MTENKSNAYTHMRTPRNLIILSISLGILLVAATFIFGLYVLLVALVSIVIAGLVELLFSKVRKLPFDQYWFITPLVFTLLLPPSVPLWIAGVGSFFGYFFGKSIFGGAGKTVFNPALVGILFVTISFPSFISTAWLDPVTGIIGTQTPLSLLNSGNAFTYSWAELLFGNTPGSIGETFRLGILALGVILIAVKAIDWRIPVGLLATVFVLTLLGYYVFPDTFANPYYSLFTGSVLFAAFFVATEPVSAPAKPLGKLIYGVGIGLLIVLIRNLATFPEGTVFAIVLMNVVGALFDSGEKNSEVGELSE
ncbi:RnfABCDGE type electron transport complex subunit D [Mycoplasmatota bacterium]|nr:RnfABCDGE type electron transport complex subunit D [Mycoplasmatota bacterium]